MFRTNILKILKPCSRLASTSGITGEVPNVAPLSQARTEKSINQVTLLGRVGASPQLRGTEDHPVTVFTVATHVNYKYQNGNLQQRTEWHRISVFKPFLRDAVYKYLSKGQRVLIQGKLMYGQITDAAGTIHTTATVVADEVIFFNKAPTLTTEDEEQEEIL